MYEPLYISLITKAVECVINTTQESSVAGIPRWFTAMFPYTASVFIYLRTKLFAIVTLLLCTPKFSAKATATIDYACSLTGRSSLRILAASHPFFPDVQPNDNYIILIRVHYV